LQDGRHNRGQFFGTVLKESDEKFMGILLPAKSIRRIQELYYMLHKITAIPKK
jgi:hypothetical protein